MEYQNSLTAANVRFAKAAGNLLTNYKWERNEVTNSKVLATSHGLSPEKIYFGIDVWAQNTQKLGRQRVTYPRNHGGGTMTGFAVAELARQGVSSAVFAPAWSFEHFFKVEDAEKVENAMLKGTALSQDPDCGCGNSNQHRPELYQLHSILDSAKTFPAGSHEYLYTDFNRAFSAHDSKTNPFWNDKVIHSQLGAQAALPNPGSTWTHESAIPAFEITATLEDLPSRLVLSVAKSNEGTANIGGSIHHAPLYHVALSADGSLEATFKYCQQQQPHVVAQGFYFKSELGILYAEVMSSEIDVPSVSPVQNQVQLTFREGNRSNFLGTFSAQTTNSWSTVTVPLGSTSEDNGSNSKK